MSVDRLSELLGLDPIPHPQPIDIDLRMPTRMPGLPTIPAASLEDRIAREAGAAVEREEGFDTSASHRLRGAYDGDSEHRIALKAIELFKRETAEQAVNHNGK